MCTCMSTHRNREKSVLYYEGDDRVVGGSSRMTGPLTCPVLSSTPVKQKSKESRKSISTKAYVVSTGRTGF